METATIYLLVYLCGGAIAGVWYAVEELMEWYDEQGHLTLVNLLLVPWYGVIGAIFGPFAALFMAILFAIAVICELPIWKKPIIKRKQAA